MRRSWRPRLAHGRRRRRLAVGVGEQRHVAQVGGHRRDGLDEAGGAGEPDLLDGALHHERVGQVVDVLAGAAEVDELGEAGVLGGGGDRGEAALEEVLDGLDVVQRLALDRCELLDLGGAEVLDDLAQGRLLGVGQGAHPRDDLVGGQPDQPLDLDPDAGPVEGRLGQVVDERRHDAAVATVERTEGDGRGRVSKRSHGLSLPEETTAPAHSSSGTPEGPARPAVCRRAGSASTRQASEVEPRRIRWKACATPLSDPAAPSSPPSASAR
jgi:hypothetical protein